MDTIPPHASLKQCSKCQKWKPATTQNFHRHYDKFHAYCKVCRNRQKIIIITPPGYKYCSRCKKSKPQDSFHKNPDLLSGLHSWCKPCVCLDRQLKQHRKMGWNYQAYQNMLASQGGVCKICKQPPKDGKRLHTDHCHKSGRIRGLLCETCNWGLGHFKDNPELLRKAAEYLEE
jgi:recombination endonuclease VII